MMYAEIGRLVGKVPKIIEEHAVNNVNPKSVKYQDMLDYCSWSQHPAECCTQLNMFNIIKEQLCQQDLSRYVSVVECPFQHELHDTQLAITSIRDSYLSVLKEDCSLTVS